MSLWITLCALGVILSLAGERRSNLILAATGKLLAATSYVAAAWSLGAAGTDYGRVLLAGMAFCWMGDLFLVSNRSPGLFLMGLSSFLLGHVVYISAFAVYGVSGTAILLSGLVMAVFAWQILRWLKPFLDDRMRRPVWLYVTAISLMMAFAVGAYASGGNLAIPAGALLFLLSDLAVARDRFVTRGFINRAWGLPLYFGAQMILASSVDYL